MEQCNSTTQQRQLRAHAIQQYDNDIDDDLLAELHFLLGTMQLFNSTTAAQGTRYSAVRQLY